MLRKLNEMLEKIGERERVVFEMVYGLNGKDITLKKQIAKIFGRESSMWTAYWELKAIEKICIMLNPMIDKRPFSCELIYAVNGFFERLEKLNGKHKESREHA